MKFDPKSHWEKIYQEKEPGQVSWYQSYPTISLEMIALAECPSAAKIIDVGAGASVLVDQLLEKGFRNVTVLDISAKAVQHAKERLGKQAEQINWIVTDVTEFKSSEPYDLWHDRAVFHFLTDPADRKKYVEAMKENVRSHGHVIIATFALDGPPQCSGLNVERYDSQKLREEVGSSFHLIKTAEEVHVTPWESRQKFIYCLFGKE